MRVFKKQFHTSSSGASLIELVVYVAIFSALSVVVVNTLLSLSSSYGRMRALRVITGDAHTALERFVREIRLASDVDGAGSVLDVNPSFITLVTVKSHTDPTPTTKEIYVTNDRFVFKEGSDPEGYFTSSRSNVTSFVATQIITPHSKALKITFTIESGSGKAHVQRMFYTTIILKGGY